MPGHNYSNHGEMSRSNDPHGLVVSFRQHTSLNEETISVPDTRCTEEPPVELRDNANPLERNVTEVGGAVVGRESGVGALGEGFAACASGESELIETVCAELANTSRAALPEGALATNSLPEAIEVGGRETIDTRDAVAVSIVDGMPDTPSPLSPYVPVSYKSYIMVFTLHYGALIYSTIVADIWIRDTPIMKYILLLYSYFAVIRFHARKRFSHAACLILLFILSGAAWQLPPIHYILVLAMQLMSDGMMATHSPKNRVSLRDGM